MNRIVDLLLVVLLPLSVVACSNSSSPQKDETAIFPEEKPIEGMIKVSATGKVLVGTNSAEAKLNEKPEMRVSLDYDFYMDVHEATCGEYKSLSKFLGSRRYSCNGDSLPLTAVTYYDAVLFANARSLRDKYDTVYSYVSASFDEENHCIFLEGLNYHPENEGYRLPTEAEWIKAASEGWNAENSWNADNSGYKVHEVCSKDADSLGFCDFSGNVMEWVNDFLGKFKDTTITNYMGSLDGGTVGERVVKGGSYRLSKSSIHLYSRGDVYTVTSVSVADYVGFRLALGKIENPVWVNDDGSVENSRLNVMASAMTVKAVTGTYNMKLAFRNDETGNLAYVDYLEGGMDVVEVEDSIDVYHPEISPNGTHVAFCTLFEGVKGHSKIYVQDLDEAGSNRVVLNVDDAAIPRWHVSESGDTSIIYVSNPGNNKDSAEWKSYSTWKVPFEKGRFGVPEKLFDGSYHGGVSEDGRLAVSGASLLRALSIDGDDSQTELWLDGEQACNVSLVKDGSRRTLFLDFGSKTGRNFVGEKYGVHQRILIADSLGNLVHSIKAPPSYTFDHSEWSSNGEKSNIVATLANGDGAHKKIVLINTLNDEVVELVDGEELWHPCLWVSASTDSALVDTAASLNIELDPDSAGIYYLPGGREQVSIMRYKMELLWQYKDSANVVIMGSSRAYYGADPTVMTDPFFCVNMAVPATTILFAKTFFDNYILNHMKKLKYLVISIDPDRGSNDGHNDNNIFFRSYTQYPGYVYDMNHNFWRDSSTTGLYEMTYATPGDKTYARKLRSARGYHSVSTQGWGDPVFTEDSCWMDTKSSILDDNFRLLEDLIATCQQNDIIVVGVLFPTNPKYQETGALGYAGLRRSEAPAVISRIAAFSETYSNFVLMDENKMGDHDYGDDMAHDNSHLSHTGAVQMANRLDSLLRTLELRDSTSPED